MTYKAVYVLGAGGHARVVIDALLSEGIKPAGVIDPVSPVGSNLLGVEVIGGDEVLKTLNPTAVWLANGVGATPGNRTNERLYRFWYDKGFRFVHVRHSSAVVSAYAVTDDASQVMAGAVVQAASLIQAGAVVNTGARVDHDCVIGRHCFVAPSVTICGGVRVGEGTFIGAGAVLLPGLRIGRNVLIAANTVVDTDVLDDGSVWRT
jgi:sugar O-acyltransferase (sialic acid O-acetyltransferase NeuD family)